MNPTKVVRPVKDWRVSSSRPNPLLRIHRTWQGPVVVMGEFDSVVTVDAPGSVVVPLLPNGSAVSRSRAATMLRRAAPYPAEVYAVAVESSSGIKGVGLVAVPVAVEPRFTCG